MDMTETDNTGQQDYDAFSDADYEAYEGAVYDQNCAAGELSYECADLESDLDGLTAEARDAEEQGAFAEADGYRSAAAEIEQDLALIDAELALVRTDDWLRTAVAANAQLNAYSAPAFSAAADAAAAGRD